MASHRIGASAIALVLLGALAPPARGADARAWDQAAVAKLGAELAKACIAVYDEFYSEQGINPKIGSGDAADAFRVRHAFERLEEESLGLAGALAAGKGRDATIPRVENIGVLSRDLRVLIARMYVMAPLQQRLEAARAVWLQILPYYGIAAPTDEAPPQG